ncbi:hypothetical protein [Bradyrhizobium sp. DASA03120]|uniref:hypothetical protein n=1 Tax=Bradyrhizobium sp. SMVTL-02 TaxID=3395917 RepID=UPI003F7312C1
MEVIRNVSNSKTFNTAVDTAIVTRISLERDPVDGAWCETHSRLMHKPNGKLYLIEETQEPGAAPAFYGARCPTYPNCTGGCGLGCTHEVEPDEGRKREVVRAISRKHAIAWLINHPARRPGTAAAERERAERLLSAA